MTFSWDFNTGTLIAIGVNIVLLIVFLVKTNNKATSAHELALKAHERADDAHRSIAVISGNLSLLREQVARDYPDHDALGNMEKRLVTEIHSIRERLDQFIDGRRGGSR